MSDLYGQQYMSDELEDFLDAIDEHIDAQQQKEQSKRDVMDQGDLHFDVQQQNDGDDDDLRTEVCPNCGSLNECDPTDIQCMCCNCDHVFVII